MNDDSNYDKLAHAMKEVPLREPDTASKVMERIREYERKRKMPTVRKSFRVRIWAAAIMLLVVTAVSVQGDTSFLFHWNGMEFSTYKAEPETNTEPNSNLTDIEIIDNQLKSRPLEYQTLTLEESQKESPFTLMRPTNIGMTPSRSFGVAETPLKKPPTKDEWYLNGFYDYFEQGDSWIVVRQSFAPRKENEGRVLIHYPDDWEVVKVSDRIMSKYYGDKNEGSYTLHILTEEKDNIWLSVTGNVSKKQLVALANAYIGNK